MDYGNTKINQYVLNMSKSQNVEVGHYTEQKEGLQKGLEKVTFFSDKVCLTVPLLFFGKNGILIIPVFLIKCFDTIFC